MTDWADWIGRDQSSTDVLTPSLAARWCRTFDRAVPREVMPQGIHLVLCPPDVATEALGADGHPKRAGGTGFLPPIPLPRRMWTGSQITFHEPLIVGAKVERRSTIASITPKEGKRGPMVFVTVEHETRTEGRLAVGETQQLAFLDAVAPDAPPIPPVPGPPAFDESVWDRTVTVRPDERLLFRYSALTFNTHRIHYDAPYAEQVEQYRGLVVHGPLLASLLLQLANEGRDRNALASFAFRAVSPAIANEPLHLALRRDGSAVELAAFAQDGRRIVEADAALRSAG